MARKPKMSAVMEAAFVADNVAASQRQAGYQLTAVRDEGLEAVVFIGVYRSLDECAVAVEEREEREEREEWPEGHEAIAEGPDGRRWVYVDGWEPAV